jgi:hypothetical protein
MGLQELREQLQALRAKREKLRVTHGAWKQEYQAKRLEVKDASARLAQVAEQRRAEDEAWRQQRQGLEQAVEALRARAGTPLPGQSSDIQDEDRAALALKEKELQAQRQAYNNRVATLEDAREELSDSVERQTQEKAALRTQGRAVALEHDETLRAERAKSEAVKAAEHVVWEGPLCRFKPQHLPKFTAPTLRIAVDVGEVTAASDAPAIVDVLNDIANKVIAPYRETCDRQLAELDRRLAERKAGGGDGLDGELESMILLLSDIEYQGEKVIPGEVEAAVAKALDLWASSRKENWKFKVKAFFKVAWAAVKAAFATSRLVLSSGADVTAYISLAKAILDIAKEVKGLLATVVDAWKKVEEEMAALKKAADSGDVALLTTTVLAELLGVVQGSILKLKEAVQVHKAKLGGQVKEAEKLSQKLEELLGTQAEGLTAASDLADLYASTASMLTATQDVVALVAEHMACQTAAADFITDFETERPALEKVAKVARYAPKLVSAAKDAPDKLATAIDAFSHALDALPF